MKGLLPVLAGRIRSFRFLPLFAGSLLSSAGSHWPKKTHGLSHKKTDFGDEGTLFFGPLKWVCLKMDDPAGLPEQILVGKIENSKSIRGSRFQDELI